jgi:hypothetical protein
MHDMAAHRHGGASFSSLRVLGCLRSGDVAPLDCRQNARRGTATGAGGGVVRTPDGGTEPVICATSVGLGICPSASDVFVSRPMPSAR